MKFSSDKVKITFYEAKNKAGQKFDSSRVDTYKAVYFVEPASKHPSYHISRNITVKERASVSSSGKQAAEATEDGSNDSGDSEDAQEEPGSGLTAERVMMQAEEQGIDLMAMPKGNF